jgi:hypothetical protein
VVFPSSRRALRFGRSARRAREKYSDFFEKWSNDVGVLVHAGADYLDILPVL